MGKKPSLQDIATPLKVSKMTVSLALRNHPSISKATRKRVAAKAKELDYRGNQELSKYMTALRRSRGESSRLPIAYLTTGETPDTWKKSHTQVLYRKGAHEQAAAYGYYLDEFWVDEPGMTAKRLSNILWSRGIRAVLIHPFNRKMNPLPPSDSLRLDWDQFSTVVMSDTLMRPALNRVIHAHYESMMVAMNRLVKLGYRRIGYCMSEQNDLVTNRRWQAAYRVYVNNPPVNKLAKIPPLVIDEINSHSLRRWLKKYEVEAFVSASPEILDTVGSFDFTLGRDVAYVDLDLDMHSAKHSGISGIDQNSLHFGHAAVDLVINDLLKNEYGIPPIPMAMQIEGTWCDRGSTPPKSKS